MDLQDPLKSAIALLLRKDWHSNGVAADVRVTQQTGSRKYVSTVFGHSRDLAGIGISSSLFDAYSKALGEFGEALAWLRSPHANRCGIAAGWLKSNAIERAKAELIERDAFIYHYRNRIPFMPVRTPHVQAGLSAYCLQSASKHHVVTLVTKLERLEPVCFGLSCSTHLMHSIEKALNEYLQSSINNNADLNLVPLPLRLHALAAKCSANVERFRYLCEGGISHSTRRTSISETRWEIETLTSPMRFLKVVRVDHPDLMKMEFGVPEPGSDPVSPLYHPMW